MSIVISLVIAAALAYGLYRWLWPDTHGDLAALAECRNHREQSEEVSDVPPTP